VAVSGGPPCRPAATNLSSSWNGGGRMCVMAGTGLRALPCGLPLLRFGASALGCRHGVGAHGGAAARGRLPARRGSAARPGCRKGVGCLPRRGSGPHGGAAARASAACRDGGRPARRGCRKGVGCLPRRGSARTAGLPEGGRLPAATGVGAHGGAAASRPAACRDAGSAQPLPPGVVQGPASVKHTDSSIL
jgi:hypothetical protein